MNPNPEVGRGNLIKVLIGSGSERRRRGNFAPAGGRRGAHGVTRPIKDGLATCHFDFIAGCGVRVEAGKRPGETPGPRCWPAPASGEMVARQNCGAEQTAVLPVQAQGLAVNIRWDSPMGAQRAGEVGPNRDTVGTPRPAAKCSGPVSPATNTLARASTARNNGSSAMCGQDPRRRREPLQLGHERGFALAARGGEDDRLPGGGGQLMQGRPMGQRPFLSRLAGGDMANHGVGGGSSFWAAAASAGSAWISVSSEGGGGICQPAAVGRGGRIRGRGRPPGARGRCSNSGGPKTAALVPAQPVAGADEPAQGSRRGRCWRNPRSGQSVPGAARGGAARFPAGWRGRAGAAWPRRG